MNEREALLRAICDNPDDDTPRLVFADWLQEHGDEARAEFIRVQVELPTCCQGHRRLYLTRREHDLLNEHEERWLRPVRPFLYEYTDYPYSFRRGFVDAMELNERTLVEQGDRLFQLTPLTRADLPQVTEWEQLAGCSYLERLRALDFTSSDIDTPSGVKTFFGSPYLRTIRELSLDRSEEARGLDLGGLDALTRASGLTSLRALSLKRNQLGPEAVTPLESARFAPWLESLDLDGIDLADEGLDWLAECDRFTHLKHLSLADNHISDRGARRLIATPWFWKLESIDLSGNGNPDRGDEPIESETCDWLWERFGARIKVGY